MSDPEAEAAAVLDEMHQAIRTARFDDLETYSAELETVFSGFQMLDSSALTRLRQLAVRNIGCLDSAAQGLRSGRRRLAEIAAAERTDTYDRNGARKTLSVQAPGRRL